VECVKRIPGILSCNKGRGERGTSFICDRRVWGSPKEKKKGLHRRWGEKNVACLLSLRKRKKGGRGFFSYPVVDYGKGRAGR